jgi:hypothetical protein
VDADAAGRFEAVDLPVEVGAGGDQLPGDHAVGHHGHLVVHVVEEGLEGADPLGHAALQHVPLPRRNDPGDDVERKRALFPREVERHTAVQEGAGHRVGTGAHVGEGELAEGVRHLPVRVPGLLPRGEHLVVGSGPAGGHGVILE